MPPVSAEKISPIILKGSENDLSYFIMEAGQTLGITNTLSTELRKPEHVLEYIFNNIVEFKSLNQSVNKLKFTLLPTKSMIFFYKQQIFKF